MGGPLRVERKDHKVKRGDEAYEQPCWPRKDKGTAMEVNMPKGQCDRLYNKCYNLCTRYKQLMLRPMRHSCKYDCYRKRRSCYFNARPAHLKVRPEYRKMMGFEDTMTYDEWVDSLPSTRKDWRTTEWKEWATT